MSISKQNLELEQASVKSLLRIEKGFLISRSPEGCSRSIESCTMPSGGAPSQLLFSETNSPQLVTFTSGCLFRRW